MKTRRCRCVGSEGGGLSEMVEGATKTRSPDPRVAMAFHAREHGTATATRYVLAQIDKILQAAGCTRHDIVKCTAHLADIEDFDRYNAVYKEFFKDVVVLPARTTVQSVLWNAIRVEIDCVAKRA